MAYSSFFSKPRYSCGLKILQIYQRQLKGHCYKCSQLKPTIEPTKFLKPWLLCLMTVGVNKNPVFLKIDPC